MKKQLWLLAGAAALGAVPTLLGCMVGRSIPWDGLATSGLMVGKWLRNLSLSGWMGNLASWVVVLLVSALPVALLLWHHSRGGEYRGEDWLLTLASVLIFTLFYLLVNPTLLSTPMSSFFPLAAGGTLLSMAAAWLVLKLLRGMEGAPADRLARAFVPLLVGCAAVVVFGAVHSRLADLMARCTSVRSGNTGATTGGVSLTLLILVVLAALELAPELLAALTLLWGAKLAGILSQAAFGQEAVDLCGRTAAGCKHITQATVLLAVFANLLQLSLMGQLLNSSFSVSLPLFPLVLSATLFLLCRCLQRGKELQEDSDSII